MSSIQNLGSFGASGSLWMDEAEIVQSDWHDIETDRKDEKPEEHTFRSCNHFAFRLKTLGKAELFFDLLDGKRIEKRKVVDTEEKKDAAGKPLENQKSEQAAPPNGP